MTSAHRNCGLAVALAFLGGCAAMPVESPTVKIGLVAPLSGPIGHLGLGLQRGAQLAIDEANAEQIIIAGRIVQFELVARNDQADPQAAVIVAQKLVDEKVKGVVGHLNSGTSIPASRVYAGAGVPMITPTATNPLLTEMGLATTFRVISNDHAQGQKLANFALNKLHISRVAVIDDRTTYGKGLANAFVEALQARAPNIRVQRHFTHTHAISYSEIVNQIRHDEPDLIFFGGMDGQAARLLVQLRPAAPKTTFLTGDGACTPEMIKLGARELDENSYCSQSDTPLSNGPAATAFSNKYRQQFGSNPQIYSQYAYDAAIALISAMKAANSSDPLQYLPSLKALSFEGISGPIAFSPEGDIKSNTVSVYRYTQGKWELTP